MKAVGHGFIWTAIIDKDAVFELNGGQVIVQTKVGGCSPDKTADHGIDAIHNLNCFGYWQFLADIARLLVGSVYIINIGVEAVVALRCTVFFKTFDLFGVGFETVKIGIRDV